MREKYIEERFPRYFEFGKSKNDLVDVSSSVIDPIVTVPKDQAEVLIRDRDKVIDMLIKITQALNKENSEILNKIWYR